MLYTPTSNSNLLKVPISEHKDTAKPLIPKIITASSRSKNKKLASIPFVVFSWIVIGILTALLLGVLAGVYALSFTKAPLLVAQEQVEAILDDRLQDAYSLFTDDTKAHLPYYVFREMTFVRLLKENGAKITFSDRSVDQFTAEISGDLVFENQTIPITYILTNYLNTWQIRNISFY